RPGVETVPGERQFGERGLAQVSQAEARDEPLQVAPVQQVELGERDSPATHLLHAGLVLAAPGIGEGQPVEFMTEGHELGLCLARNSGAPVRQGAEYIEQKRLYGRPGGIHGGTLLSAIPTPWPCESSVKSL